MRSGIVAPGLCQFMNRSVACTKLHLAVVHRDHRDKTEAAESEQKSEGVRPAGNIVMHLPLALRTSHLTSGNCQPSILNTTQSEEIVGCPTRKLSHHLRRERRGDGQPNAGNETRTKTVRRTPIHGLAFILTYSSVTYPTIHTPPPAK